MSIFNLSYCNLIGLASSLAIAISEDLTADEIDILAAFFNAFSDNLAIIATKKSERKRKKRLRI